MTQTDKALYEKTIRCLAEAVQAAYKQFGGKGRTRARIIRGKR